jgi:hypothetical protein
MTGQKNWLVREKINKRDFSSSTSGEKDWREKVKYGGEKPSVISAKYQIKFSIPS